MGHQERKRVAIVGTGIGGLSCSWFMKNVEGYDCHLTLFEKEKLFGMDSQSLNVVDIHGKTLRLNTPPRSYSKSYYPNLFEVYRMAGVESELWSWAYTCSILNEERCFFRVGKTRLLGFRLPSYCGFSQWWRFFTPTTFRIIRDAYRFHSNIVVDMYDQKIIGMTMGDYLKHLNLSHDFIYKALLPMLSMICTCTYEACLNYPCDIVFHYFVTNSSHGQYRTKFGTCDAATRLAASVDQIHTDAPVKKIWHKCPENGNKVKVEYEKDGKICSELFDEVIMATQANDALWMIQDLSAQEKGILESFDHQDSRVVIHKDERLMPKNKADWSPMNIVLPKDMSKVMFTIWSNDSYKGIDYDIFQTWNPILEPKPELLVKSIVFQRPLVTKRSLQAVKQVAEINGMNGIWYCGAWSAHRIPLQESAVVSALEVCQQITGASPTGSWTQAHSHLDCIKADSKRKESLDEQLDTTDGKMQKLLLLSLGFVVLSLFSTARIVLRN